MRREMNVCQVQRDQTIIVGPKRWRVVHIDRFAHCKRYGMPMVHIQVMGGMSVWCFDSQARVEVVG